MPRVFLNYRREDSAGIAGRLFDRLCFELGRENVFRDLDTLVPGADFAKVIADQVASCDALIAVIGKDWLTARDGDGHRRLDHPGDFVKTEIREALARDKLVIPALVEGAGIPKPADLPPEIAALAARNAIEISDSRFDYDTERLIRALQAHTNGAPDPRSRPAKQRRSWAWVSDPDHHRTLAFIGAGITAAAIAGWTVYVHFSDKVTPVAAPGVSASSGGIATGGDVTAKAGRGGTAIVATGPVTIGITVEQYEANLKRREQEVREELARTHRVETDRIALLEKELAAAVAKRQNPEQALSDFSAKLAEASQALEKLKGDLPADQLAEARQALGKGDTAAAEALFTEALAQGKAQAAAGNEKAADAAFQLGELAYQRIDYARAYDYYLEAAKLQPDNPEHLNMAGRIAHDVGRYAEAHTFLQKALAIREKSLDPEHPVIEPQGTRSDREEAHRALEEGALADPVAAHEAGAGSLRDLQRQVPERVALAVILVEINDGEHAYPPHCPHRHLPHVHLPHVRLPHVHLPHVRLPHVRLPDTPRSPWGSAARPACCPPPAPAPHAAP